MTNESIQGALRNVYAGGVRYETEGNERAVCEILECAYNTLVRWDVVNYDNMCEVVDAIGRAVLDAITKWRKRSMKNPTWRRGESSDPAWWEA